MLTAVEQGSKVVRVIVEVIVDTEPVSVTVAPVLWGFSVVGG